MRKLHVKTGFVPLLDAAPLVIARELDFAANEGLELSLLKLPSWSSLRDFLSIGQIDTAHVLSPLPLSMSLGLGGLRTNISVLMVISVNGTVLGVSNALAKAMRDAGWETNLLDAHETAKAVSGAWGKPLRIGVPFPNSMHRELVDYWLETYDIDYEIRAIPPSQMSDAVEAGEVDMFCVGEPWGSYAVDKGNAELCLAGKAIWAFSPEKVLAARSDWLDENPDTAHALIRAVWQAGKWLEQDSNHAIATEILSRDEYLGISPEVTERALSGHLLSKARTLGRHVDEFVSFHRGSANFPWRSQASWIGERLARRAGLNRDEVVAQSRGIWRSDVYRTALLPLAVDMPISSIKVEGSLAASSNVASVQGSVILRPNRFFDGKLFDPDA